MILIAISAYRTLRRISLLTLPLSHKELSMSELASPIDTPLPD